MRTKTNVKAGGRYLNHNETIKGVAIKTQVKPGGRDGATTTTSRCEASR